ncbi:MAG: pitrilysin family protein [Pseudomonadota bacterium]
MIRFALTFVVLLGATAPANAAVEIQEVTSPGGITAWLVEEDAVPFTALEIQFQGGGSLDRDGKRGAINLMTATLEEGAGELDAQAFAVARDELAASFSFDVGRDGLSVSVRFLTENRDEALALLKLALTEPRFDEDAVARVREQILSGLRSDLNDPNTIAGLRLNELAYGDHPYATSLDGTLDSVAALTREDVVNAYGDVIVKDRIFVGAAGDISADELATIMDDLFGDLPTGGAPLPPPVELQLTGGVTVEPLNVPQSVALFGHIGIPRDDPDFFPAFVANEVFGGGGLQSRLSMEVREERGLTYGIGSYLVNWDHANMLLGQFATANDRAAEAIQVVLDEWAKIAAEGVTEEELDAAKTYLTGAYPLRFDSNASIARILVGMQADGLPIDYIETRNSKVEAVTLEDVKRVSERLYQPEALRFVVVGQPDGLEGVN